ncbi:MAG: hypothetical protein ACJAZS_000389 [Alteromonas naphthalenivorans]|jgi:hypothetical protein
MKNTFLFLLLMLVFKIQSSNIDQIPDYWSNHIPIDYSQHYFCNPNTLYQNNTDLELLEKHMQQKRRLDFEQEQKKTTITPSPIQTEATSPHTHQIQTQTVLSNIPQLATIMKKIRAQGIEKMVCPFSDCKKHCKTGKNLFTHLETNHSVNFKEESQLSNISKKIYICLKCSWATPHRNTLSTHNTKHFLEIPKKNQ